MALRSAMLGFALGSILGCSARSPVLEQGPCGPQARRDSATRVADVQYRVVASHDAAELCVEADLPASATRLDVPARLAPFVRDAQVERDGRWETLSRDAGFPFRCAAGGCRIHYRFMLGEAATQFEDRDLAVADRGTIYSPLSMWLLRAEGVSSRARYKVHVEAPAPLVFVSGVFRAPGAADTYEGVVGDLDQTPYGGFGPFDVRRIDVPGAVIEVALTPGGTGVSSARLVDWIATSSRAVASYYGGYPIRRAVVIVRAGSPGAIGGGSTMGEGGASILLQIGRETTETDLRDDWVLVHEMVHVSFPSVLRPWAEEGLATYVEPLIRVRAGLLDKDQVWRDLVLGLPKGLPEPGDQGLDRTDTWGRRYWGGALFWFKADVEIRRRTNNQRSLDDALRGVAAAGGNVAVTWKLEEALRIGDEAVGVPVLRELFGKMASSAAIEDLDGLFRSLGVGLRGRDVVYDDAAPLAAVRQAITAPRK